jgi:sec-independent protein translocase protein TatA
MELVVVAIIALLVLGPKRLPDAGRSLGKSMREFKDAIAGVKEDATVHLVEDEVEVDEAEKPAKTAA